MRVERLGAVVAGADGDAVLIAEGGHVMGVHAVEGEGEDGGARRRRAEEAQAGQCRCSCKVLPPSSKPVNASRSQRTGSDLMAS